MSETLRRQPALALALVTLLLALVVPALPGRAITQTGAAEIDAGELDAALETLTPADPAAPALYNLGVAWFRKGDAAHAVGAFRAASELAPRDSDIGHNLAVARLAFTDAPAPAGPAVPWASLITPGELGVVALLAWIAAGGLVQRWRAGDGLQGAAAASAVALVLSAAAIHGGLAQQRSSPAIVLTDAALREAPEVTGRVVATVGAGAEVRVDGATDDFARVEDGTGRRGWVPKATLYAPSRRW